MPELSASERETIARKMWWGLGQTFAEGLVLDHLGEKEDFVSFENAEVLEQAHQPLEEGGKPRGLVLVSMHSGNWEAFGVGVKSQGIHAAALYQSVANPLVDQELRRQRTLYWQAGMITKGSSAMKRTVGLLRKGGGVGILTDHRTGMSDVSPLRERPARVERMILFVPPHIDKVVAKLGGLIPKVDVVLGNLEDAVPADQKDAARAGLVKLAREHDFGQTGLWARINCLNSPWVLEDITTLVEDVGDKLDVVMLPKIEIARDVFSPPADEVAFALRILEAMPDGTGAVMIDGKMQDDATWKQAKVLADLARQIVKRDPEMAGVYGLENNTEEWWNAIPPDVRPEKDQPFYHLLAENEETEYVAYVSEQNLLPDDSDQPLRNAQIAEFFYEGPDGDLIFAGQAH
eukprot:g17157.t1